MLLLFYHLGIWLLQKDVVQCILFFEISLILYFNLTDFCRVLGAFTYPRAVILLLSFSLLSLMPCPDIRTAGFNCQIMMLQELRLSFAQRLLLPQRCLLPNRTLCSLSFSLTSGPHRNPVRSGLSPLLYRQGSYASEGDIIEPMMLIVLALWYNFVLGCESVVEGRTWV